MKKNLKPRNWLVKLETEIRRNAGAHGKSQKAIRRQEKVKLNKLDYSVMWYSTKVNLANVGETTIPHNTIIQ